MTQKTKNMLRWIPSLLIALQLSCSAIMKFLALPFFVENFSRIGLAYYMNFIGCIELLFLMLFMGKRTMRFGLLLLTGYFGGAMAIEAIFGNMIAPAIILAITWLAAGLRDPQLYRAKGQSAIFNPLATGIHIF